MELTFLPIAAVSPALPPQSAEVAALIADVTRAQSELYDRTRAAAPWIGYFAQDAQSGDVLGSCSFVGPPADGAVEIAYFTFPFAEGRGVAGRMAAKLVEIARVSGGASAVIAHTLPEENASTKILSRLGFAMTGPATDDEVGPVWKWELQI